ncbi:Rz1 family lipoprotein, partial [Escherichia coli]|nr:Rz1 family lipoprotein [Escherichia coli]HBE7879753.1 Rz1 family lipoprotein [Escherichia coli]
GCSSKENALCHPQTKPPAPPAWAMMPPSNSLQLLDETFSVSGTELSATKQH